MTLHNLLLAIIELVPYYWKLSCCFVLVMSCCQHQLLELDAL